MKTRTRFLSFLGWVLALAAVLIPVSQAFAQDEQPHPAVGIALGLFLLILGLACYVYISLALQIIAKKTNTPNDWLAWIPIANVFLMLAIARKPLWWIVLLIIPLVNIVISIIVWMRIAEARNKPSWRGILMLVPGVSLIVPGYLAWSD